MNALSETNPRDKMDRQIDTDLGPLVRRMAGGDEAALGAFYDRTIGHVYGLALRITGRADAAEEVAGDVYMQVWREASRYQPDRARVLGWLMMICRSRALDHLRRQDRADLHAHPDQLYEIVDDCDPADLVEQSCAQGRVRTALQQLSAIQRELIALAFFHGLTHQEIATQTAMPLGTIKTHIRRGLAALQLILTAE